MSIPVSIDSLISDHRVEDNRVEYKSGWNPLKVLHSVCAFANDIDNQGGGYIVIGVSEDPDGVATVHGLSDAECKTISNELNKYCSYIEPHYYPVLSFETFRDCRLAVIMVISPNNRPFRCPVSIGGEASKKDTRKAYYIRRLANTVEADGDQQMMLFEMSRAVSFDNTLNISAQVNDIRADLVRDYLNRVGSRLADEEMDTEVYEKMRIVGGSGGFLSPYNVGLMMFTDDPERYFPYARIEVVIKPDPSGNGMTEYTFRGPLDKQLRDALGFIRNNVISERVFKVDYQPEALRYYNYPFPAVEEILVNAVFHKDYMIEQPIEVYVERNEMVIRTYPGPDMSIKDDDISKLNMTSQFCRNRRLGDFFKELHLTEGRNTGMKKIKDSLIRNGSEMPVYETDEKRRFLRVTIPVHESFRVSDDRNGKKETANGRRTPEDVKKGIIEYLRYNGCSPAGEISKALGYRSMTNMFRRCLKELMEEGAVSYLYPESPNDMRQRICLNAR